MAEIISTASQPTQPLAANTPRVTAFCRWQLDACLAQPKGRKLRRKNAVTRQRQAHIHIKNKRLQAAFKIK